MDYHKIQLQLDSQCAVTLLQTRNHENHAHATTLQHTSELLRQDWEA
ncbi:hypothetical protein LINPERHAP1_LOCUS32139 [Linum perenne]